MKRQIWVLLTLVTSLPMFGASADWPRVVELQREFHVVLPVPEGKTAIDIFLTDHQGKSLYRLRCGSYDTDIQDFAFSGDFECALQTVPPDYKTVSTLFAEKVPQTADWQSRARFLASELRPPCGAIPDFGSARTFRLRGMKITLSMTNIKFSTLEKEPHLKSFDFQVSVVQDDRALGEIAATPFLAQRWHHTTCVLDNSVTPHFETSSKP